MNETENALVGSIFIEPSIMSSVKTTADDFISTELRNIFSAMQKLHKENKDIDIITVKNELDKENKSVPIVKLAECSNATPTSSHWETYDREIREKSSKRRLKRTLEMAITNLDKKNVVDVVGDLGQALDEGGASDIKIYDINESISSALDRIIMAREKPDDVGIKFSILFEPIIDGEYVIIAGRPSMGKSAMIASMMMETEKPIGFFSLEMTKEQLMNRLSAGIARVPNNKMKSGEINDDELQRITSAYDVLSKKKLYVCENRNITTQEIRAEAFKMKNKYGVKIIFIDYLQIVKKNESLDSVKELTRVSNELCTLAKDINIPVVCLSQISRFNKGEIAPRPTLSDLRGSGGIEENANAVVLLHSDDYYNDNSKVNCLMELIIAKQRDGRKGSAWATFSKPYQRFIKTTPPDDF